MFQGVIKAARVAQVSIAQITVKQLARHEREFQASERACECETKELAQKTSHHRLQELSNGADCQMPTSPGRIGSFVAVQEINRSRMFAITAGGTVPARLSPSNG
jgi:hypothetical protein